ncbi:phage tail assembly protein [Mangrovibacter sp. SLW1]
MAKANKTPAVSTVADPENPNVVTLDRPIQRAGQVIDTVTLTEPNAGTLRGVSLAAVAQSEVDALIKVLPRMTYPALTTQELTAMNLPDMLSLASKVIGFLSPASGNRLPTRPVDR